MWKWSTQICVGYALLRCAVGYPGACHIADRFRSVMMAKYVHRADENKIALILRQYREFLYVRCRCVDAGKIRVVAGLFRSEDGYAWTLLASFSAAGKDVNEFDFEKLDNGDFIAVFREDTTAGRQLYFARSAGGDNSWGALAAITQSVVAGTQPTLIKLADGRILLAVGDRTGVSGMSADGMPNLSNVNRTGISVSIAPADISSAAQWGQHVQVGLSYSTDCGQPIMILLSNGKVLIVFYATEKLGVEPGIYSGVYTP
jgi:hypothetical protein